MNKFMNKFWSFWRGFSQALVHQTLISSTRISHTSAKLHALLSKLSKPSRKTVSGIFRTALAFALVITLVFGHGQDALARRGGGRAGGSSFGRSSAPIRSNPSRSGGSYGSYGGGYTPSYGGGGGFFFMPLFFGGGGFSGLFSLIMLMVVAGVVLQAFRGWRGDGTGITSDDSKVTVAKIQVGLLASARGLQQELTHLALDTDTDSSAGLSLLLREASVALLRHPEYWVYVSSAKENTKFALAESKFNGLVIAERQKLNAEVLSNSNGRLFQGKNPEVLPSGTGSSLEDPSEYIVVTMLVAVAGESLAKLPEIRSSETLQKTLTALGAVPQDDLLAIEILWEPQSEVYTLTSDEVLTTYPDLVRI